MTEKTITSISYTEQFQMLDMIERVKKANHPVIVMVGENHMFAVDRDESIVALLDANKRG